MSASYTRELKEKGEELSMTSVLQLEDVVFCFEMFVHDFYDHFSNKVKRRAFKVTSAE